MIGIFNFKVGFSAGKVDRDNAVIRGVSLITGDLEAEGHSLHVDDVTLGQVHAYGVRQRKITVKMDHKGPDGQTFKSIAGYLTNFTVEGGAGGRKKVRGDLELLKSEPMTPKILEMAERMPENFGLSISFKGKGVPGRGGRQFARCEKLLSVDLVEQPAANPDGLFSVPVDTPRRGMSENANPNNEPSLADLLAAIQQQGQQITALTERVEAQAQFIEQVQQSMGEPDLDELNAMTDEQLAELGYTREQVNEAIAAAQANGEIGSAAGGGDGTNAAHGTNGSGAAGVASGGEAAGAPGGSFAAQARQIIQFEIKKVRDQARQAAEQEEAEIALSVIEEKVTALSARNEELTQLNATLTAEVESLRRVVKLAGKGGVAPGGDITLFSVGAEQTKPGTFEHHFASKLKELTDSKLEVKKARSQAMDFCIRKFPTEYKEWRAKGGTIELVAK